MPCAQYPLVRGLKAEAPLVYQARVDVQQDIAGHGIGVDPLHPVDLLKAQRDARLDRRSTGQAGVLGSTTLSYTLNVPAAHRRLQLLSLPC